MCPGCFFKQEGGFEPHLGITGSRKPRSPWKTMLIITAPKTLAPASSPPLMCNLSLGVPPLPFIQVLGQWCDTFVCTQV